jgi:cytochrome c oxidase subunit IV
MEAKTAGYHKDAGIKAYLIVWGMLIFLTAITITAAKLNLGKTAILVCLAIAAIKSALVFLYFMHLRYERSILIKILIPIVIALLSVFIGLTYFDLISR